MKTTFGTDWSELFSPCEDAVSGSVFTACFGDGADEIPRYRNPDHYFGEVKYSTHHGTLGIPRNKTLGIPPRMLVKSKYHAKPRKTFDQTYIWLQLPDHFSRRCKARQS